MRLIKHILQRLQKRFLKNEDGPGFTHADTCKLLTTTVIYIEKDKLLRKEDGKGACVQYVDA